MVKEIETFATIASRPPSAKVTKPPAAEEAVAAATGDLEAAISKHRADIQAMLTSSIAKRTSARENRIRADNVALMTSATIRIQQAGGTRIALERLYEIARQEERMVLQQHEMALTTSHAALSKIKPTMSVIKDAEGFSTVNRRSSSPLLTANHAPTPGGKVRVNLFTEEFLKAGEDDLKDYSLDPSSHQLMEKAFRGDETSLVTAALSTTTAHSPARASIYTKNFFHAGRV